MVRPNRTFPRLRVARAALLLLALALLWAAGLWADPGGESTEAGPARALAHDLSWWTVDGGGSSPGLGPVYSLGGTAGQPDAATWAGSSYTLVGGFWGGPWCGPRIYLPLVLRGG